MNVFQRLLRSMIVEPEKKTAIETLQEDYDTSREMVLKLKAEIAVLNQEKKITEEDIKHMVRLKEEKLAVQNERKQLEREREKETAIFQVKDEYRDKLEKRLQTEVENIKQMYSEILQRLPKVSVRQVDKYETIEDRQQ
jgi:histone H3/H4